MKRLYKLVFAGICVLSLAIVAFLLFGQSQEEQLIAQGNDYISRINQYVKDKGRLPVSLQDIGVEERLEGPIYYEPQDSSQFILWFGTVLGESVIYDSRRKTWE